MCNIIKKATREGYGEALVKCGEKYSNLVVLDADLAESTKTIEFQKQFPDRFFDCGIAEGNMVGIAAGLATAGKIPVISSFAMFLAGRGYEQIRNSIAYTKLNVKIAATHAGLSVGEDGATHQCNEDITLMRSIPGLVVISPSDYIEAQEAVKSAIEYIGPVYIRFGRANVPIINNREGYHFQLGKGEVLREGNNITIIATGIMVSFCLEVAERLEEDGISAEVINIHTIKPLDEKLILTSAKKTGKVVTVEEHSVIGGLGSAICECLSENNPVFVHKIGIQDCYGESGTVNELLDKYGISSEGIYNQIKLFLERFTYKEG